MQEAQYGILPISQERFKPLLQIVANKLFQDDTEYDAMRKYLRFTIMPNLLYVLLSLRALYPNEAETIVFLERLYGISNQFDNEKIELEERKRNLQKKLVRKLTLMHEKIAGEGEIELLDKSAVMSELDAEE